MDQQFIELFDTSRVQADADFLPDWPEIENDLFPKVDPFNDEPGKIDYTADDDD